MVFGAPYVPTRKRDIERAFNDLYAISATDLLVDIGSGDGVVLRVASKHGAKAVGYELNPLLVLISRYLSKGDSSVRVKLANFWNEALPPETTIVYTFGESRDIEKMGRKVAEEACRHNKTIYFLSYGFSLRSHEPYRQNKSFFLYRFDPSIDEALTV